MKLWLAVGGQAKPVEVGGFGWWLKLDLARNRFRYILFAIYIIYYIILVDPLTGVETAP